MKGESSMFHLQFNMTLMNFLADHRDPILTKFFLVMTFLGEVNGYILIVTLVSVPIFPALTDREIDRVRRVLPRVVRIG